MAKRFVSVAISLLVHYLKQLIDSDIIESINATKREAYMKICVGSKVDAVSFQIQIKTIFAYTFSHTRQLKVITAEIAHSADICLKDCL
jgi:hypothetical protein